MNLIQRNEGETQINKNNVKYIWVFDGWQKDFKLLVVEDGMWCESGHYKTEEELDTAIDELR